MDQCVIEILKQITYPRRETALLWILAGNTVSLSYYRPIVKRNEFRKLNRNWCRPQWPHVLRRRSAAARLLRLRVGIPPRAWIFVVSVVWYHVGVSATSWSPVQRSPTDCGVSLCVVYKPHEWRGPGPLGGCRAKNKQERLIEITWKKCQIKCLYCLSLTPLCVAQALLSHHKQDRRYTYKLILSCVRVEIVVVEKQWLVHILSVCVCVCVFSH
jgi:hypothetical protein